MQIVNIGKTDWYKAVMDADGELVSFGGFLILSRLSFKKNFQNIPLNSRTI